MPRSGINGTYSLPGAQKTQVPDTPIQSAVNNQGYADIEQTFNTPQPIAYGGTGEATAVAGTDALSTKGTDIASATTTDIGAATGRFVHITGTTTITGLGTKTAGVVRFLTFDGILTLTHNATSLILPGAANIVTAAGDTATAVSEGGGNWRIVSYQRASGAALVGVAAGYIKGLTLSNNTTDATNDIDVAAGECASDGGVTALVTLASGLTKQLDAAWAVGTNAGMRASGAAIANTTYHIFLIRRPDTGVVDVAADTSVTGANLAANTNAAYTQKRRIGSIVRSAGVIQSFTQVGDIFVQQVPSIVTSANVPTTGALYYVGVPLGLNLVVNCDIDAQTASGTIVAIRVSSPLASDLATVTGNINVGVGVGAASVIQRGFGQVSIITDTSGQIRMRTAAATTATVSVTTNYYIDTRGRM